MKARMVPFSEISNCKTHSLSPGHYIPKHKCLSPRETEVANLARQGLTNKEIAEFLVVSIKTVEFHLRNIYLKLEVPGRDGLKL